MDCKRGYSHKCFDANLNLAISKRSQVTLFIIIAIVIVAGLLVYFLWIGPTYVSPSGKLQFEKCVKEVIEKNIEKLGINGGFVNPEFTILYQDEEIPYLCYTNLYYEPCINQMPFLINNFANNLKEMSEDEIWACYEAGLKELKRQGYEVIEGDKNLEIELNPNRVNVIIDAPVVLGGEGSQKFTRFNIAVDSRIYEMTALATSIIQFETRYGDSDTTSMMTLYPNYRFDKFKQGDGTTIYIIEDKDYGNKFQFASRSLVFPPGYGLNSELVR